MREYSGENIFLGYIKNYEGKVVGKIGRIHNDCYFSMFMQINDNSCFDLSNNCLYVGEELLQIKRLKNLNPTKDFSENRLKKVMKMQLKTL